MPFVCYIRLVTNPMRHTLLSVNLIFNLSTVGISVVYKISSFAHTTNWMGKRKKKPIRSHFGDVHSSYVFHSPRIHFLWFSHQNISFVRSFVSMFWNLRQIVYKLDVCLVLENKLYLNVKKREPKCLILFFFSLQDDKRLIFIHFIRFCMYFVRTINDLHDAYMCTNEKLYRTIFLHAFFAYFKYII